MNPVHYSLIIETTGDDLATTRKGMVALSEWADAENVLISWVVDARVARSAGMWLNERRARRHGASLPDDEVILRLDTESWIGEESDSGESLFATAERRVQQREDLPKRVAAELGRVRDALPWANPTVAAAETKNEALIYALEAANLIGLWGYRWNEASPRAQDRGCPFGFFYAGRQRFQSAGAPMSGVVGVPRMTGDLSLWRRIPPEPPVRDFADHVSYAPIEAELNAFRSAVEIILENAPLNVWNAATHPLNAARFASPTENDGDALVALWRWLREREVEFVGLQDAVGRYRKRFPETEPTMLLWGDRIQESEFRSQNSGLALSSPTARIEGVKSQDNVVPPSPHHPVILSLSRSSTLSLYYYDSRSQFVFQNSGSLPVEMCNYVTPSMKSRYLIEYELPTLPLFFPQRHRDQLRLEFSLDAPKPMPYALFLWGDHLHLRLRETNILEVRWLGRHGLLLLLDLEAGANDFYLVLSI